jgi:hypothetical protein
MRSHARLLLANRLLEGEVQPPPRRRNAPSATHKKSSGKSRSQFNDAGFSIFAELAQRDGDNKQALHWYQKWKISMSTTAWPTMPSSDRATAPGNRRGRGRLGKNGGRL